MPAKKSRGSMKAKTGGLKSKSSGNQSGQDKAGLIFPPGRCTSLIRKHQAIDRVSYKAGVQIAGALEYLVAEIIEQAGDVAKEAGFKRIKPRHL
jgi:histone H3/H4